MQATRMLIIQSGHVFTGLQPNPWAEAVGIENDRIAAVGTRAEVKGVLPQAEILELPGRLITPGLVDGHCHFVSYGRSLLQVDLRHQPDLEACRGKIRDAAAHLAPGRWLLGRGWNHHQWPNPKEPDKADLDDIVPDHPMMMARVCGHSVWVNSRALSLAGITATTPDPPGGRIDRDASGAPTGLLRAARQLIDAHIPPPTVEEDRQAALAAQADALGCGLTGVHTCETLAEWRALAALDARGELKIRVHHLLPPADLAEAQRMGLSFGGGSNTLWIGHQKLFADGSLGAGTALLQAPYCDDPANFGLAQTSLIPFISILMPVVFSPVSKTFFSSNFFISSTPAPPLPIIMPGLPVLIMILIFPGDLSISTFSKLASLNLFSSRSLILRSSFKNKERFLP